MGVLLLANGQAAVTAAALMTKDIGFGEQKSIFRQDGLKASESKFYDCPT
jgi:hypothetical protein